MTNPVGDTGCQALNMRTRARIMVRARVAKDRRGDSGVLGVVHVLGAQPDLAPLGLELLLLLLLLLHLGGVPGRQLDGVLLSLIHI